MQHHVSCALFDAEHLSCFRCCLSHADRQGYCDTDALVKSLGMLGIGVTVAGADEVVATLGSHSGLHFTAADLERYDKRCTASRAKTRTAQNQAIPDPYGG